MLSCEVRRLRVLHFHRRTTILNDLPQPPADGDVLLEMLGSFRLRIDGEPTVLPMNAQRLVCFLALHDGALLRQHVAGSLWGETNDQAVQAGMLAVSGEPLRESAQRALISAHIAEGNVDAATTQYNTFRELLHDKLDLEPSEEMKILVKGLHR